MRNRYLPRSSAGSALQPGCAASRADGARHVRGAREGDLGERLLGRGVDGPDDLAVEWRDEVAADEQVVARREPRGVAGLRGGRVVPAQRGARFGDSHGYSLEKSSARP